MGDVTDQVTTATIVTIQIKHNSNHLSVHQWIRSAIRDSQEPTSPIGFLFLKLPPPPCAVLLVYYIWVCLKMVRIPSKMTIFMEKIWWSSQVGDHICFQCRKDGNLFSTRRLGDVSYTKNCMGKKRLSYFRCFQSNAGESFFPAPFPEDALSHHYFSIFFVIIIFPIKMVVTWSISHFETHIFNDWQYNTIIDLYRIFMNIIS